MDDGTSRPASPPPRPEPPAGDGPLGEAAAWTVLSTLITGPALYGGGGWLLDRWLGTEFIAPIGIVAGMALSLYVVYVRYGTPESPPRRRGE